LITLGDLGFWTSGKLKIIKGSLSERRRHSDGTHRVSEHSGVQGQGLRKGCKGAAREVAASKIEGLILGNRLGYLLHLYFLRRAIIPGREY
jgi:hypothetical protein